MYHVDLGERSNMAAIMALKSCRFQQVPSVILQSPAFRGIHTTAVVCKKNIRTGRYQGSRNRSIPLTYEEAKGPSLIGVEKAWNSWNSTNLKDEGRKSETTTEDAFIRSFLTGTWHELILTEIVIKRRHNMIYISYVIKSMFSKPRLYFLVGYTEELLSCLLKCCVKLEVQVKDPSKDLVFKRI